MLDLPRYLLGVLEVVVLAGFSTFGAVAARRCLLPSFSGAPAHLATAVLALTLLIGTAELLGSFGVLAPVSYLAAVAVVGVLCRAFLPRVARWRGSPIAEDASASEHMGEAAATGPAGRVATAIALAVSLIAVLKFGVEVKPKLSTGMTGFDSTWYHAPFAAGFFQGGSTWDLHFIAPQFLAWFYPANAEIFHATGMLAFDRDLLSPLLNLGWFGGCLVACWCIGRPYRVELWSLLLGAVALSLPLLTDQAGEARNDIVGIFFLLTAVAVALNARRDELGAAVVVGLAAGLAAGTKLNFLLPAAVLVLGLPLIAPAGARWRTLAAAGLAALAGGGYWYLRNLAHTGNPLPWLDGIGPVSLPAPDQALGGREGHSVLGYLADGAIWSDWFLPGLRDGLTILWPLLLAAALAGLVLCALSSRSSSALRLAGSVGLAAALAWLIAPTSASGPEGMPRGFESGLRYLAPALVLGLALAPIVHARPAAALALLVVIAIGYPVQRHYLENRYANPTFAAPGLNAAFEWAGPLSGARIATTSTRQYPLYGTGLSNHVEYVGEGQPHGGFTAPTGCGRWRHLLNAGHYDYVVTSRDRVEGGKPSYPDSTRWTEGLGVEEILRVPPTVVFKLKGPLDPAACRE